MSKVNLDEESNKSNQNDKLQRMTVFKSNTLITSKYSMNARSLKLITACLNKINPFEKPPVNGTSITLTTKEIKDLLNTSSHSLYEQMKNVRDNIGSNNTIFYEDDTNNKTGFFVLVESCEFDVENGITINFGKTATPFLYEIQKSGVGFTKLKVSTILNLTSAHAIRFYELFKKCMFRMSREKKYIEVEYGLNELKIVLGLIDLNSKEATKCRKLMNDGETDYDKIMDVYEGTVPYKRIDNFKDRVIETAQRELKEMTEIRFEYEPIKKGRAINAFKFKIYRNIPENKHYRNNLEILDSMEELVEDEVIDYIIDIIEEKRVKVSEAKQIAKAGEYNIVFISKAYELFKQQRKVSNVCGWLVSCLNDNYENIKGKDIEFEEVIKDS